MPLTEYVVPVLVQKGNIKNVVGILILCYSTMGVLSLNSLKARQDFVISDIESGICRCGGTNGANRYPGWATVCVAPITQRYQHAVSGSWNELNKNVTLRPKAGGGCGDGGWAGGGDTWGMRRRLPITGLAHPRSLR